MQKRSDEEKTNLFALLKEELLRHRKEELGVSFKLRGIWQPFTDDQELKDLAAEVEKKTSGHTERVLTVLFGYDGAAEGNAAMESWAASKDAPTWDALRSHAWTSHIPAVDLYIRTGSEYKYLSGSFLPFKLENTLLQFPEKYWPDYTVEDLNEALKEYAEFVANRRNGK